jgi:hypothetical protein
MNATRTTVQVHTSLKIGQTAQEHTRKTSIAIPGEKQCWDLIQITIQTNAQLEMAGSPAGHAFGAGASKKEASDTITLNKLEPSTREKYQTAA